MMSDTPLRLLVLGAHPDDAEYSAGGLVSIYRELGHSVKLVSLTNGAAGHHERPSATLGAIRRAEAAAAGRVVGAPYETWDIPDGELLPTLDVRWRVIREIRSFAPDLVLTHRISDYHPDHRAVGQVVQDASYLVTVPNVLRDVPALRTDPVVAYMVDLFTQPNPFRPDVLLDVSARVETIVAMLACHRSQVFEWLPYSQGILSEVPADEAGKLTWLRGWYQRQTGPRADRFRRELRAAFGDERGSQLENLEAYELSEYAAQPSAARLQQLFPTAHCLPKIAGS